MFDETKSGRDLKHNFALLKLIILDKNAKNQVNDAIMETLTLQVFLQIRKFPQSEDKIAKCEDERQQMCQTEAKGCDPSGPQKGLPLRCLPETTAGIPFKVTHTCSK